MTTREVELFGGPLDGEKMIQCEGIFAPILRPKICSRTERLVVGGYTTGEWISVLRISEVKQGSVALSGDYTLRHDGNYTYVY